jgi:hypothetical protein
LNRALLSPLVPTRVKAKMPPEVIIVRRRLGFEISLLLCAKVVVLAVLYLAFFDSGHQIRGDAPAVRAHVLGAG